MAEDRSTKRIKELEDSISRSLSRQEKIYALNELAWELRMEHHEKVYALTRKVDKLCRSGEYLSQPYASGISASLVSQAFVDTYKGNLDIAVSKCLQALAILKEPRSHVGVRAWFTLGWNNFFLSNYSGAMENGLKALELARELKDELHEAWALDAIASFHGITGDFESAVPLHEEALTVFRSLQDELGEMRALNNLAVSLYEMKEFDRAYQESQRSLHIAEKYKLTMDLSNNSCTLADILVGMGRLDEAEACLKESIAENLSDLDLTHVFVLTRIGTLRMLRNDLAGAESYTANALDVASNWDQRAEKANCYKLLSEIYEKQGQYAKALGYHKQYHEIENLIQGEQESMRLAVLKITHQVESAQREAEIYRLKATELERKVDEQKIIQKVLEVESTIDPLTGLHNRRYFDDILEREYARHSRSKVELSLIIIDVDHFKAFNDTYGHLRGDDCLRRVAKVISDHVLRPPDVAVRFGGEEFVCLLPETSLDGAKIVAEHIRQGVLNLSIPHKCSTEYQIVTLSIGIASIQPIMGGSPKEIVARADEQLYKAKARGRNCIESVYIE